MNSSLRTWINEHSLSSFFISSFFLAWIIWIPVGILKPTLLPALSLIGAWAPTLSAILLTGVISGKAGIGELLKKGLRWRIGIRWYVVVIFGIALIGFTANVIHLLLGGVFPQPTLPGDLHLNQLYVFLPIIFLSNIFLGGPIAEEFGWRGFALPRLQMRIGALCAGLVIGVAWGLWHLPFFVFKDGSQVIGNIPLALYMPLIMGWSVLFAWIFNNTDGSVLMMILFHAAINTTLGSLGLFQIASSGIRPLMLNIALTWVVVVMIAVIFGPDRLTLKHESYFLAERGG